MRVNLNITLKDIIKQWGAQQESLFDSYTSKNYMEERCFKVLQKLPQIIKKNLEPKEALIINKFFNDAGLTSKHLKKEIIKKKR